MGDESVGSRYRTEGGSRLQIHGDGRMCHRGIGERAVYEHDGGCSVGDEISFDELSLADPAAYHSPSAHSYTVYPSLSEQAAVGPR